MLHDRCDTSCAVQPFRVSFKFWIMSYEQITEPPVHGFHGSKKDFETSPEGQRARRRNKYPLVI